MKHPRQTPSPPKPPRRTPQAAGIDWSEAWLWLKLVLLLTIPALVELAGGSDLIYLRDDCRSIIFAGAAAAITAGLWWSQRSLAPRWPSLARAWLALVSINRLAATPRVVPVTIESSRVQSVYYKRQHFHHDLLLRAPDGHTWRARFFGNRGDQPFPPGTPANATLSEGPLWDDVDALTLPERTLHASRVP